MCSQNFENEDLIKKNPGSSVRPSSGFRTFLVDTLDFSTVEVDSGVDCQCSHPVRPLGRVTIEIY